MVSDAFRVFRQGKIFRSDLWRTFTIDKSLDVIVFHLFGQVVYFLFNHEGSLQSIVVIVMISLLELKKRDIRRLEQRNYLFPKVSIKKMQDDGEKYLGEVFCTFWRRDALWRDYWRYMIDNNGKVDWKHSDSSNMLLHRDPGPDIY